MRETAFAMVRSHFDAWVDFLHFATRPPEESRRLIESVEGYENIVEARRRGKGVVLLTAHLGNWEVGGLMLAEVKQPIHVVLVPDIFPGRRARAAPPARAQRRDGDPGRPELRPDAGGSARPRRQRHRRDAGRPRFRQHRRSPSPFFGREAYFPARAPARGDGLGSRRAAGLHRARARRAGIGRSSRGRSRSRRPATATRRCGRTSRATSRSSSATSGSTRSSGTASIRSGTILRAGQRPPPRPGGRRAQTAATKNAS